MSLSNDGMIETLSLLADAGATTFEMDKVGKDMELLSDILVLLLQHYGREE